MLASATMRLTVRLGRCYVLDDSKKNLVGQGSERSRCNTELGSRGSQCWCLI